MFLTLLGPLSLNGLQHKALVIQDAMIIVNTITQQDLQHKVISLTQKQRTSYKSYEYLKCPQNTKLYNFQIKQPTPKPQWN